MPLPASAQALPDAAQVLRDTYATDRFAALGDHETQARFTDAVICALHATDNRWGNLVKRPAQTNIHGHAEDSALFLRSGTGNSQSVDFITNSGAASAAPGWIPDQPRYSASDWAEPHNCGVESPEQPPTPPTAPDLTAISASLARIESALLALANQAGATQSTVSEVGAQLGGIAGRIEVVLQSNDRILRQQLSPPEYNGRYVGTLRPTVRPVTP